MQPSSKLTWAQNTFESNFLFVLNRHNQETFIYFFVPATATHINQSTNFHDLRITAPTDWFVLPKIGLALAPVFFLFREERNARGCPFQKNFTFL